MIYFLLMMCAFAVGFLLWVLVALIREGQHLTPHRRKADRARCGPISRIGELIHMNPKITQDENAEKTTGKRTVLMVLGALLFTLPLHGQQTTSDASDTAVLEGTKSDQPIPPAVRQELEAMKKRIEQLEAQLQRRDGQGTVSAAEGTQAASQGPNAPEARLAAASFAQPSVAQPLGESTAAVPAKKQKVEPFSDWDWTWLNGNPRNKDVAFDSKFFTPEIRADITYTYDFNKPIDNSIGGSSEIFRSNEIQLEQLGLGGDFHYDNVRARFMTQFGMYSTTTVRNDPSYAKGQWNINEAHRYLAEAYGGYHINALNGINVDAGIFLSYIGLFSYYNADNWAYQPSYVSSNTPWFFEGLRVQIFPTPHLKIEPWLINGWQSYASANSRKGLGGQIKWTPRPWVNIISNNYGLGHDDLYNPKRGRIHTDDSIEIKYYDKPGNRLDKMAFSFTGDLGCEFGGGVSCYGNRKGGPKQSFIGYMLYNRAWFKKDTYGLTIGGGQINNPGRYLVLLPPINGETAPSAAINAPYFTGNPGDPFKAWDTSITFDYMPRQWLTFRWEYDYRHASVPYWTGRGGITPPGSGGLPYTNNGSPQFFACNDGNTSGALTLSAAQTACGAQGSTVWFPDLRKDQSTLNLDILVKF
jgi:hypothetical protein